MKIESFFCNQLNEPIIFINRVFETLKEFKVKFHFTLNSISDNILRGRKSSYFQVIGVNELKNWRQFRARDTKKYAKTAIFHWTFVMMTTKILTLHSSNATMITTITTQQRKPQSKQDPSVKRNNGNATGLRYDTRRRIFTFSCAFSLKTYRKIHFFNSVMISH